MQQVLTHPLQPFILCQPLGLPAAPSLPLAPRPHPSLGPCCRAEYVPRRLLPPNQRAARLHSGLSVEYFDFAPSLGDHLRGADLVISHAGG